MSFFTNLLTDFKFNVANGYIKDDHWGLSFCFFLLICLFYAGVAGAFVWQDPAVAGPGIPEIKAFLNGINLEKVVGIRVLFFKAIGMCFSVSAGLPLGKLMDECSVKLLK